MHMQKQDNRADIYWMRILGPICKLLLVGFGLSMFMNVLLRFGLNTGFVKLQDFQAYIFAALIMLAIAFACAANKHVRAGLFSENERPVSSKFKALLESLLGLFSFAVILVYSMPGVIASWQNLEGSTEPDGLGGYFLVRTALPVLCALAIVILGRKIMLQRRD